MILRYAYLSLGGANYSTRLPYHSHIDVEQLGFSDDPSGLANYLKQLISDDSNYSSYFWWKDYYSVSNSDDERAQNFCKICQKLHNQQEKVILKS